MTDENEIERMAIEQIIRDEFIEWLNVAGCIPQGTTYWCECMGCIEDSAAKLVSAGIGDKKQAVKEFAERIYERGQYISDDSGLVYRVVLQKSIDELFNELYGAEE